MIENKSYVSHQGNHLVIGNEKIEGKLSLLEEPRLISLTNKITNTEFNFTNSKECVLRLGTASKRMDILEWLFHPGSGELMPHEDDLGFQGGFYKPELDVTTWLPVQRINDFPIGAPGYSPVLYPGFGWYRCFIELPADAKGEPIELVLGGHDNQDWEEYWVFLNGIFIGHANPKGYWHDAPKYVLHPLDPGYEAFHFGTANILAVQTRGLDRSTPQMVISDIERYSVGSFLADQYVSAGPAMSEVSNFRFLDFKEVKDESSTLIELHYANAENNLSVKISYWINDGEETLYKQIVIENTGREDQVLLELDLHGLSSDAEVSIGGMGIPCTVGNELFCGISHPAGISQSDGKTLCLTMLPGKKLISGDSYVSKAVIFGVGPKAQGRESFVNYLEKRSPRSRKLLHTYNSYGIYDVASVEEPTYMTENMIMNNLADLETFRARGISFDYYYLDTGWNNPLGDLQDFNPKHFPNGPARVLERISELGMKVGLWTSPSSGAAAFIPGVFDPRLTQCGTLPNQESVGVKPHRGALCLTADPWRQMYENALRYHVRENGVSGFKFDGNEFWCTNTTHDHMPGKYSVESIIDTMIEILEAIRQECPEIMYMFYWNIRSPWWLLFGDTIYERGILMEGSTPADFPTRILRQSITLSYDQAAHHAWDLIPLCCGDSLGVWISKWRWANYIGREGWQDAWIMDIARGSLLYQLWGDLSLFEGEDIDFLEYIYKWATTSPCLLQYPKRILGDPWKAETYGYTYFDKNEGIIFLFNPSFEHRTVTLHLGTEIGFSAARDHQIYEISSIYSAQGAMLLPGQNYLSADEKFDIILNPFEVKVLQVSPCNHLPRVILPPAVKEEELPLCIVAPFEEISREDIFWEDPTKQWPIRRMINGRSQYVDSLEAYQTIKARSDERDRSVTRRVLETNVHISPFQEERSLFVSAILSRDGIYWHHHALFDIVLVHGSLNSEDLPVRTTPSRWHEEAGGWSWILFEIPLVGSDFAREISLEIEAYLPKSVDMNLRAWLFKDEKNTQKIIGEIL